MTIFLLVYGIIGAIFTLLIGLSQVNVYGSYAYTSLSWYINLLFCLFCWPYFFIVAFYRTFRKRQ